MPRGQLRPPTVLKFNKIYCVDALQGLKQLDDESIDCVMTSPPYWCLRDYDTPPLIWHAKSECKHEFEPDDPKFVKQIEKAPARSKKQENYSGFCKHCSAWRGSLGLEPTVDLYLDHLCSIFDEVQRVLKKSGTLWINIGDMYAGSWGGAGKGAEGSLQRGRSERGLTVPRDTLGVVGHARAPPRLAAQGVREKSLCLVPARFAIEMASRGWILRNDIVWHKPNHMPSSVKDRFACSWEHLFLFVKSPRYYFDLDAVRVPHVSTGNRLFRPGKHARARDSPHLRGNRMPPRTTDSNGAHPFGKNPGDYWTMPSETRTLGALLGVRGAVKVPGGDGWVGHVPGGQARIIREMDPRWLTPGGKNPGDCWDVATRSSQTPHFAVYPEQLCERPIKAGCPERVCAKCGAPAILASSATRLRGKSHRGFPLACDCEAGFEAGVVLDPFVGAGTTAVVAKRLRRRFIGLELNPDYVELARRRPLAASQPVVSKSCQPLFSCLALCFAKTQD